MIGYQGGWCGFGVRRSVSGAVVVLLGCVALALLVCGSAVAAPAPLGAFSEFSVPTSQPFGIAAGPDGNLWFTDSAGNQVGRVTPAGTVTEFTVPTANSGPRG